HVHRRLEGADVHDRLQAEEVTLNPRTAPRVCPGRAAALPGQTAMKKELVNSLEDVFVVRGFLSPAECEHFIALSASAGFGDAPINTFAGQVVNKGMRNNDRVMIDDPALAMELWERLRPFVAPRRGSHWVAAGLNERFRFYRYDPGQRFHWHFDGC